jgi:hypothetical protein
MKPILFIVLAILFNVTLGFSQDIITTRTGEDILAKILEINKTEIKYKKFDNQDGPLYTLLKADILMIRYENGSKEIFTEDTKNEGPPPPKFSNSDLPQHPVNELSDADKKLFYAGKSEKFRRMKRTGTTLTILGGVLLTVGIVTLSNSSYYTNYNGQTSSNGNPEAGAAAFLFGVGGLGAGIPLWTIGAHQQKKYFKKSEGITFRFNIQPQGKGVTLAYHF